MKTISPVFIIITILFIASCTGSKDLYNLSTEKITDNNIKSLLNKFSYVLQEEATQLDKANDAEGFNDKISSRTNFLVFLKQSNITKTNILDTLLNILDTSSDITMRLNVWTGIEQIFRFIDLEKLKHLNIASKQDVTHAINTDYDKIFLKGSNLNSAMGYINYNYDDLQQLLEKLGSKEEHPDIKKIVFSVLNKFK